MTKLFADKVALITGGSSGIGRATAIAFAKEGAKVVIAARREQESQRVIDEIKAAGSEGLFVHTDVAKLSDLQNIRVNAISPAGTETEMFQRFTDHDAKKYQYMADAHPIGRIGKPEEIASAVIWLCSPGASFVTGHTMTIDGGFTAQ